MLSLTVIWKHTTLMLLVYIHATVSNKLETEEVEGYSKYGIEPGRLDINIQDLEQNIARACDRLRKLDDILTTMYKDPPVDGGNEFMRLSRTFNKASLDLLYLCTLDKHKALKGAHDMVERGGPKFLDLDVDEELLEQRFKWNEDSLEHLHIVRKDTREHWYDLWHLYNNLP